MVPTITHWMILATSTLTLTDTESFIFETSGHSAPRPKGCGVGPHQANEPSLMGASAHHRRSRSASGESAWTPWLPAIAARLQPQQLNTNRLGQGRGLRLPEVNEWLSEPFRLRTIGRYDGEPSSLSESTIPADPAWPICARIPPGARGHGPGSGDRDLWPSRQANGFVPLPWPPAFAGVTANS